MRRGDGNETLHRAARCASGPLKGKSGPRQGAGQPHADADSQGAATLAVLGLGPAQGERRQPKIESTAAAETEGGRAETGGRHAVRFDHGGRAAVHGHCNSGRVDSRADAAGTLRR